MKSLNYDKKFFRLGVLAVTVPMGFAMSGCGKSNSSTTTGTTTAQYSSGNVNQNGVSSTCSAISGAIPFGGNFYIDSANLVSSATVTSTTTTGQGGTYSGSGSDGYITLQLSMLSSNTGTGSGQMQLSSLYVQALLYKIYYGQIAVSGYTPGTTINASSFCASISGINLGHYNTTLYGGTVQLLLNNTTSLVAYF